MRTGHLGGTERQDARRKVLREFQKKGSFRHAKATVEFMTEGNETVSEFALTSGELYLASGAVEKKDMRRPENYAGPTRGGVRVKYTARVSEIFDEDGNVAATLRYGERTCVSGTLARISPRLLSVLIGSDAENIVPSADGLSADGSAVLALSGECAHRNTLSFLLICPLDGGEEFQLYLRSSAPSEAVMELGTCSENGISFSVTSESGLTGKRASVSFSPAEVSA